MDHQNIDDHDPTSHPLPHDIELSILTEPSEQLEVQSLPGEPTDKNATSPPLSFFKRISNCLLRWSKNTETPIRSVREELKIELQEAISKVHDLGAKEWTVRMEIKRLVCTGKIDLSVACFIRHHLRMQIRKAQEDVADIQARLEEERKKLPV